MTDNWNENKSKTRWTHKKNPNVFVLIRKNIDGNSPKYFVYHTHPGPGTHTIMQDPEGAMTMESARKRARKHVVHWGPSEKWSTDPDFNHMGKKGT